MSDSVTPAWPARRLRDDLALTFILYGLLAFGCLVVARQPGTVAVVWLANGLGIGLVASAPRAHQLPLLLACAAGNLAANLAHGDPPLMSLAFALSNGLEVAVGGWLLQRVARADRLQQDHVSFLRVLCWGGLLPPLVGATLGAAGLQQLGYADFDQVWLDWYIGAALGAVVMLPLVLSLRSAPKRWPAPLGEASTGLALGLTAVVTWAAFRYTTYPFVVIVFVMTLVAFTRPRVVSFACAPVAVTVLALSLALGHYHPTTPDTPWGHAVLFLSAMLTVMPPLVLAVVVARQRALADMLAAVGSRDDDIIAIVDRDGVYRWVNRARERYHGVPASAVLGRALGDVASGRDDRDQLVAAFDQALAGHTTRAVADVHYAAMGTRTMDLRMQPAHDAEGHLAGVLFSAGDITELENSRRDLQRLADQLRASNHELEQFVRIASHDLREPLNTVLQFTRLIESGPAQALGDDGRLYFAQVREGTARMKRMLDDLLQYVRLEGAPAAAEAVSLDQVLAEVRASLLAQLQTSAATLQQRGDLGTVQGHPALLTLALQNLVSNGLKFMAPGQPAQVEVSTTCSAGELWLTVADNGIGIDAERLDELGTPFRRLHARRKYDGTGLGLAIVKRIAKHHGGRLHIESVPGQGSRFSLVLPRPT